MKQKLSKTTIMRLLVAFLIVLITLSSTFAFLEGRMYYQRRENKLYLAANQSKLIEGSLDAVMARVYTLRSLVKADHGSTDFFESSVPEIYDETVEDTGLYVKNFILAPKGVVDKIYPLEGNEGLLGLDYTDQTLAGNVDAMQAYKQNKLILTEPFSLKQGGTGIAGRLPVYLEHGEQKEFWGMVSVTLDMNYLLKQFNLKYLEESGTDYCLWYTDDGGNKVIVAQSEKTPKNPISYEINPQNLSWTLDVAPKNGWLPLVEVLSGAVIILFFSILVLRVLETKARIQTMNVLLEEIAIKDNLTGCFSRHYVNVVLLFPGTKEWKDENACYSMAVVDVDSFKQINDTYGHDVGDQALVAIAKTLQSLCDELRGDCVIRYGGDEFIFMMNNAERSLFENRLKELVKKVSEIRVSSAPEMRLSVSVGAVAGKKNDSYYDLFARADKQVYLSKENGKNQYHLETAKEE